MSAIQKASPSAKRKAIWILLAGSASGVFILASYRQLENDLHSWIETNIEDILHNTHLVFLFALLLVTPLIVLAIYLFRFGHAIRKSGRFPPPGHEVIRDTRVYTANAALVRGQVIQVLALAILLLALSIPFLSWYMFYLFVGTS